MVEILKISNSKLPEIRNELLKAQNFRCALCNCDISGDVKNQHVDHQHCTKSENLGENGAGLIRGVLCRNCNVLEGKFWNASTRYQVADKEDPVQSRIKWLESLVHYYKENHQHKNPTLHPSEQRPVKLSKREYNEIFKWYQEQEFAYKKNGELKPFPKFNGKWTPKLESFFTMMQTQ